MLNRRRFLASGIGGITGWAAAGSGLFQGVVTAQSPPCPAPAKDELLRVLEAVGKPARVMTQADGTDIVLLPYGGRVLGVYARDSQENFYWTHPALGSAETARAFYESDAWHNSGGDRTWLAPEVDIFLPKYPDLSTYRQPRELDPGDYEVKSSQRGLELVNTFSLRFSRSGRQVSLRLGKSIGAAPNPLRHETTVDTRALAYAGYTQFTTLRIQDETGQEPPAVGLWNLVQMPHGGDLLVPTFSRTRPTVWFGDIAPDDLAVSDHLVRYRMRATGEHKLGIRAVATTGRVGYLHNTGGAATLIIRCFVVNPSGDYIDVPWKNPEDFGYSTQACNVNSNLGSFSELEYHVPAIGGSTERRSCHDTAVVWAFRGPLDAIQAAGRCLLSPEV
ncbi:MAG: hypothetical protein KA184_06740 [Candidatus Hydrogenedentes bacterium]|nr:hypothetical protein [Candidatus Hydrogenedentota bacterium]